MEAYVIEQDFYEWREEPGEHYSKPVLAGRCYYVQSSSKKVNPFDIRYAKIFPSVRSVKNGLTWANTNPKVFRVKISVDPIEEIEV